MEATPIKRSKYILQLSKEHHFTLLFSWKIRQGLKQGVETNRIKKYVAYFWERDMQTHFREEEEILFVPAEGDSVQKAIADHQEIKDLVNEALNSTTEEEARNKLATLANAVDEHVRYEERELFPHLEKVLTEVQLERIAEKLKDEPVLHDEYADQFWIKKL